jgi:hypothetical protein
MYTMNKEKTASTLKERIAAIAVEEVREAELHHHSDGSELMPAEVQLQMRRNNYQLLDAPLAEGYTADDEGLINTYTIEPAMYFAQYPTPKQQQGYVIQGAIAALLVTLTIFTAFSIS